MVNLYLYYNRDTLVLAFNAGQDFYTTDELLSYTSEKVDRIELYSSFDNFDAWKINKVLELIETKNSNFFKLVTIKPVYKI